MTQPFTVLLRCPWKPGGPPMVCEVLADDFEEAVARAAHLASEGTITKGPIPTLFPDEFEPILVFLGSVPDYWIPNPGDPLDALELSPERDCGIKP